MDPISVVASSAIVGGVAGKFTEKAWDSGQKWLASYFQNHGNKAREKAKDNSYNFLTELDKRIKIIEESNQISKEQIETAQDYPDFSALLQKAFLNSAETENREKHILLANIVAEKLKAPAESVSSLVSKMSCDAVSSANIRQLKILALQTNLLCVSPSSLPFNLVTQEQLQDWMQQWLVSRLIAYLDLTIEPIDLLHLEALSCATVYPFSSRDLAQTISSKITEKSFNNFQFDLEKFKKCDLGNHIFKLWSNYNLQAVNLTSVGAFVGTYVSDVLTRQNTNFLGFE